MSETTILTPAHTGLAAMISDLLRDSSLDEAEQGLVRAALDGESALRQERENPGAFSEIASTQVNGQEQREVFLKSLKVSGFRGIGPPSTLELSARPGLTIVEGSNGSGKSSFAEALELLLTGEVARFRLAPRRGAWLTGWPNIHNPSGAEIEAELVINGSAVPHVVRRAWADGAIDAPPAIDLVLAGGEQLGPLSEQDWGASVGTWHPVLSPANLSSISEQPSKLFDLMYDALGLVTLTSTESALSSLKREVSVECEEVKSALNGLLSTLQESQDERAQACYAALSGEKWDLDRTS